MFHALCVVQTISLHKLAATMPTSIERESNLLRIQRFIAKNVLNLDLVARMIFSLLPVKSGPSAEYGPRKLEVLEFQHQRPHAWRDILGIAFPLMFSLLPKRGNSNWEERKAIIERFIRLKISAVY